MEIEAGENVRLSEEELFFDTAVEEDFESIDGGVSRVQELENVLEWILDYWDEDLLVPAEGADIEQIADLMEHAGVILSKNDTEEYTA